MREKDNINLVIDRLAQGMKMASIKNSEPLRNMGIDLMIKLLDVTFDNESEEGFKYILEQIIIKSPDLIKPLSEIVNATYPQFKDHIEKLIILS